jgi:tRNA (mo5U34)-methyltransferase
VTSSLTSDSVAELQARVDAHPFWYHTIDVVPGVVTPGWFDLRPVLDVMPWPDVRGKRCLDIGTYDGFLAFELERRGAAEVVAIDIEDHVLWDWPADNPPVPENLQPGMSGPPKGSGFRLVADIKGSKVDWRPLSIYDLDPDEIGTFDVITLGTLLLHLREPIRALEAVRRVCRGVLLSSEQIDLWTTIFTRQAIAKLDGSGPYCQWWQANSAGHKRMLYSAGFDIVQSSKPYVVRYNHHPMPAHDVRNTVNRLARWAVTGTWEEGIFHRAALARPRL